jgi:four helix bundle protein
LRQGIAEGNDCFLQIAAGSARETEHHLLISGDLGYLSAPARAELTGRVKSIQRMLTGLMNNLPG